MGNRVFFLVAQMLLAAVVQSNQGTDASLSTPKQSEPATNASTTSQINEMPCESPLPNAVDASSESDVTAKSELDRFCNYLSQDVAAPLKLEAAANAIERELDVENVESAISILRLVTSRIDLESIDGKSLLLYEMARARVLAHQDQLREALQLRVSLQRNIDDQFGADSSPAFENRLRSANIQLELGYALEATQQLKSLSNDLGIANSANEDQSTIISESLALAEAFSGDEVPALARLGDLRKSLALKYGDEDQRVIEVEEEIASIQIRTENFEQALITESRVLLWRTRHQRQDHPKTLRSLWLIAYLYIANQRPETAESILTHLSSLTSNDKVIQNRQLFLNTESRLATLAAGRGDHIIAKQIRREVYESELRLLGESSVDTQIEGRNFAVEMMNTGETKDACSLLEHILDTQSESHLGDEWSTDYTRITYDRCLLASKEEGAAIKAADSLNVTWSAISHRAGEGSPSALFALATLANANLILKRRSDGKHLLSLLIELTESTRSFDAIGTISRDTSLSILIGGRTAAGEVIPGYRDLALLHAQDNELEAALRVSELARDRALGDRFAEQAWRRDWVPEGERGRLDALIDRIQALEERIAIATDLVDRVRLESERTLAVAERGRFERQLRDDRRLPPPDFHPPTLDELRAGLAPGTALVSTVHSGDAWWALVVRRGVAARFVSFSDTELGRLAAAWTRQLRGDPARVWPTAGGRIAVQAARPADATGGFLADEDVAGRLSQGLMGPLASALGGDRHLVFVGDDDLVGVPLQALPLGRGRVLDKYEISYAPSLATYARWQARERRPAHPRDLLAIGAIDFPAIAAPSLADPVQAGLWHAGLHPLPFARVELDNIAALFPPARTRAWTGSAANKDRLHLASASGELQSYRYVHFATHAWAQSHEPEGSAIALAGATPEAPAKGVLTAAELAGLRMASDLIVLSACDTGVGQFEHGRGLLGLAYASLAAGNRAALLSIWPVADDTTAAFMQRFYGRLRRGQDPAAALAGTQREFRNARDARLSDPVVWAPFVLYGGY